MGLKNHSWTFIQWVGNQFTFSECQSILQVEKSDPAKCSLIRKACSGFHHKVKAADLRALKARREQAEAKLRDLADRKDRLLKMTQLDPFRLRSMKNLSGGMKQKLGLVCSLIHEPALVILDEPTTGVDPVSRRDLWAILAKILRDRGLTALVSTAYMDEATRFHHSSLLLEGKVVVQEKTEEILNLVPGNGVGFHSGQYILLISNGNPILLNPFSKF